VQADQTIRERIESEDDPVAIFDLGVALYETGDLQGARDAWQRAMERGHRRAAVNLGFLLQRMGDRRGARKAYLKAADWGDPVAARLAEGLVVRSDKAGDAG
jgi:Flp pilus assembly protein TadD